MTFWPFWCTFQDQGAFKIAFKVEVLFSILVGFFMIEGSFLSISSTIFYRSRGFFKISIALFKLLIDPFYFRGDAS